MSSSLKMSTRLNELFPDVHQKMCKKIAQLTKVIYHLNTQNEDYAFEIEESNRKHENEIQQIINDSAITFEKFKNSLEDQKSKVSKLIVYYVYIFTYIYLVHYRLILTRRLKA